MKRDFANHGDELRYVERLSDDGVNLAGFELGDLRIVEGSDDEDDRTRFRDHGVERFKELEAVQPRHHQIENDDRVLAVADKSHRGYAIVGGVDLERLAAQSGREERPDRVVILNILKLFWDQATCQQYAANDGWRWESSGTH